MTGSELREKRLTLAFTQKEMAERLGCNIKSYRRWEQLGGKKVSAAMLTVAVEKVEQERRAGIPARELIKLAQAARRRYALRTKESKS